jgi:hypothetical protein
MLGQTDTSWDTMLTDPYSLFTSDQASSQADMLSASDVATPVASTPTLTQDLNLVGQLVQFGGQVYHYVQGTQNGVPVAQPVVVQAAPTSGKILGLTPTQLLLGGGILAAVWLLA